MKRNIAKALCIFGFIGSTTLLRAQLVSDFSNFADGNQVFLGTWAANDQGFGDLNPNGSFSQGVGVYNFTGGMNDQFSGAEYFFAAPVDISGSNALSLTMELLPPTGTEADVLNVTLYDQNGFSATSTFQLNSFNAGAYATATEAWMADASFDASQVTYYMISGLNSIGGANVDVSIDNLAAVTVTAVPEPGTYAAFAGVAALGLAFWRRRRAAA